jgi:Na+/proline symporter
MLAEVGHFDPVDYTVVAVYFIVTLAIGFWSAHKAGDSSKDFFVAD